MIRIEHCQSVTQPGWLELRQALWPESSRQAHAEEVSDLLADRQRYMGRIHGCTEMASDTDLNNLLSQDMHKALGFAVTERVVFFKRDL
jgi:aminoglycoside 6'-N-acetyltransferase I